MDADYFLTVANQTMWVLALASAPILIPALLAGLILGMIQAATSINEQTLSFVPKLLVVAFSIMIFGSLILGLLSDFTVGMFERIPEPPGPHNSSACLCAHTFAALCDHAPRAVAVSRARSIGCPRHARERRWAAAAASFATASPPHGRPS